jgi:hypothetical protein
VTVGDEPISSTFERRERREVGLHVAAPQPALTYACPDAEFGALVARLVADVAEGTGLDVVLAWLGMEPYLVVDGERRASAWMATRDRREAAAYVMDVFQDVIVETLGGAALPACAGHPHPASLRVTAEGVGWHCPATGAVLRTYAIEPSPVAH